LHKAKNLSIRHHISFVAVLLFLTTAFSFGTVHAQQQQTAKVQILNADASSYNAKLGKNIQRLIGHVKLKQDSTLFFSDSAYLNEKKRNFDAFSRIHIIVNDTLNIYGSRLHYEGRTRVAELFGNVILKDPKTTLYTHHLIYNRNTRIAHYDGGGKILSDSNVLKSRLGYYNTNTQVFHFQKHVILTSRDQILRSDILIYDTKTAMAFIKGPTTIKSKESTIHCTDGWFDTKNHDSKLFQRPVIQQKNQTLTADSIIYSDSSTHGRAYENIKIVNTSLQIVIKGKIGETWDKKGISYITDSALAISYNPQNDSLFMHADTLWLFFDKHKKTKKMLAYHQVKFFRKDLQGACDSLTYTTKDSTMRMFTKPVIWKGDNQLTSDTISLVIKNGQMDTMTMRDNGFIISKDSTGMFNQIKGRTMIGYFRRNKIYQMKVDGNAQSLYWLRSDDKHLIGLNKAEASSMLIKIANNKIIGIDYIGNPSETLYPPGEVKGKANVLNGFKWLGNIRPHSIWDIFVIKKKKSVNQRHQNTENFK